MKSRWSLKNSMKRKPRQMNKLLNTYDLPKLNAEDINNLNRPIMSNEIEAAIKSFPTKENPRTRWSHY